MRQCAEKKLNNFFSFFMAFVVSTKTFISGDLKKGCGKMLMFSYPGGPAKERQVLCNFFLPSISDQFQNFSFLWCRVYQEGANFWKRVILYYVICFFTVHGVSGVDYLVGQLVSKES